MSNNAIHNNTPVHVPVIFKKFALNPNADNLRHWNKDTAESIKSGYVYTFRFPRRTEERIDFCNENQQYFVVDNAAVTRTDRRYIQISELKIVQENQTCFVCAIRPNESYRMHFAYSRIRLSKERLNAIAEEIGKNWRYARRAVDVNMAVFMPENSRRQNHTLNFRDIGNAEKGVVYLHDWFGYLEQCADTFYNAAEGAHEEIATYLNAEINLAGRGVPEGSSGLSRGSLYTLADYMDLLTERVFRGESNLFSPRPQDPPGLPEMRPFHEGVQAEINRLRGGERTTAAIRLISLLLSNLHANSTFIDYMYGSPEEQNLLIETIAKCLHRYELVLHRQEKDRLYQAWDGIFCNLDKISKLTENMDSVNTAEHVHRHIGEASVFIFMAAIGKVTEPSVMILRLWLSVNMTHENRFALHGLLITGILQNSHKREIILRGITPIETGTVRRSFIHANGREVSIPFLDIDSVVRVLSAAATENAWVGAVGAAFALHNIEAAEATMNFDARFSSMFPEFLKVAQFATSASRWGPSVSSFASTYAAWKSLRRAWANRGEPLVANLFGLAVFGITIGLIAAAVPQLMLAAPAAVAGTVATASKVSASAFTASSLLFLFADILDRSRARTVLRHSLWGVQRNPSRPPTAPWWPILSDDSNIGGDMEMEVFITNRSLQQRFPSSTRNDPPPFMRLFFPPGPVNRPNVEIETFRRNMFMRNLALQAPSFGISILPVHKPDGLILAAAQHQIVEAGEINDFRMIRSIRIRLRTVPGRNQDGMLVFQRMFELDQASEFRSHEILAASNGRIRSLDELSQAIKISVVLYDGEGMDRSLLPADPAALREQLANDQRYIRLTAQRMSQRKRIEITLRYWHSDLLPVRIEHEFP